jgi:hypothetical protein
MTVEEALQLLVRLAAEVSMPLSGHAQAQQAGRILEQFILAAQAKPEEEEEE